MWQLEDFKFCGFITFLQYLNFKDLLQKFFLNKKFYWRKIEPPRTQGKEHKNSTDTELKVTTTQCCLRLLFHFLNGFPQFLFGRFHKKKSLSIQAIKIQIQSFVQPA